MTEQNEQEKTPKQSLDISWKEIGEQKIAEQEPCPECEMVHNPKSPCPIYNFGEP